VFGNHRNRALTAPINWRTTVKKASAYSHTQNTILQAASCVVMLAAAGSSVAGEGWKLRQSPVGSFGGDIAALPEPSGPFGSALITYLESYKILDANGNAKVPDAMSIPLPTGTPTRGALADGVYTVNVPAGTTNYKQTQTQLNLAGGYWTDAIYNDGRLQFAANLPLVKIKRTLSLTQPLGTVSPTTAASPPLTALPTALQGAVAAVTAAVNAKVQAGVAAALVTPTLQNTEASGIGDMELTVNWVRRQEQLKVLAGVTLFAPTGSYDVARGPNPGSGNFYTLRPGLTLTFYPNKNDSATDPGLTFQGRVSYGLNTTNKDTSYRSGNFLHAEVGAVKVIGKWAFGANVLTIRQTTDDTGKGAAADGNRYTNNSFGPFLTYKIPGQDNTGLNLHYTNNFGGSNATASRAVQLKLIKTW